MTQNIDLVLQLGEELRDGGSATRTGRRGGGRDNDRDNDTDRNDRPSRGQVLGEQVTAVPYGAPDTGTAPMVPSISSHWHVALGRDTTIQARKKA